MGAWKIEGVLLYAAIGSGTSGSAWRIDAPASLVSMRGASGSVTGHLEWPSPEKRSSVREPLSWQSLWYERVLATPTSLDFGIIAQTTSKNITLENRHLEDSVTVTGITFSESITLDVELPLVLRPTESRTLSLTLGTSGSAMLDSILTFLTSSNDPSAEITATRRAVWPFEPDWSDAVTMGKIWKSDVQTSVIGNEKRIAFQPRSLLRQNFSCQTYNQTRLRAMDDAFHKMGRLLVLMPRWSEGSKLTSPAYVGDTLLSTENISLLSFTTGMFLVWSNFSQWDVCVQAGSTSTSLTAAKGLLGSYPTGAWVWPLLTGSVTKRGNFSLITDEVSKVQIEFMEVLAS